MEPNQLLDNLSSHLKNAIARAISLATSLGHTHVTVLHLLVGIEEENGAVAAELLRQYTISKDLLLERIALLKPPAADQHAGVTTIPELDAIAKKALERAMLLAYEREHSYIGTEHLLHGILQSKGAMISTLLEECNVERKTLIEQLDHMLESTNKLPDIEDVGEMLQGLQSMIDQHAEQTEQPQPQQRTPRKRHKKKKPTALELFAVELTNEERQASIDPVIGRATEIERLIHILSRRTKNNPVLVGEPGVGKTAIIEGLAKRIVEQDVPDVLQGKKIYSLDLTLLISGTIYRGEFEARLKQLIDECSNRDDCILFIDEIHNIIGAGSNQGTMDAANILKPALARGTLHCVGATTLDEYKKYISNDPALDRRFQEISVEEPSTAEAIQILCGIKPYYEQFHDVSLSDEIISTAVELATKYIHDYFLPDKAIDLIDEAAAAVRVRRKPTPTAKKLRELKAQRATLEKKKEEAILDEAFEKAMQYKTASEAIARDIAEIKKKKKTLKGAATPVTKDDIAAVLSKKLHIRPDILLANEWEQLDTLQERLQSHVIGQNAAIEKVVSTLRQAHLGIQRKQKPLASFLFTGPSGVGKTKLAESLAQELYFDSKALIRIDMSEFAEAHGVSKLLGSPAGYIGYKERNKFLDSIAARPYAVVLFDEFDKAHPDVQKLLYQILDEGALTDGSGKKISFAHATIVLTSNVGASFFSRSAFGFGDTGQAATQHAIESQIRDTLKDQFGSAFLGRIKGICMFTPLTQAHTEAIILQHIAAMNTDLMTAQHMNIAADKKALKALAEASHDKDLGIRNMEHTVDDIVQHLIIETLKNRENKQKKKYRLTKTKDAYKLV